MSSPRRSLVRQRHSLRVFLWVGTVFALVQLVAGLVFDYRWPQVRAPQAGSVFALLDRLPRTPEIVCIGSSRFQTDLKDEILNPLMGHFTRPSPRVLNASVGCGDAIVAEWMLRWMLRAGHRPVLLVLEVTPENLAARNKWLEYQFIRHLTWSDLPSCFLDACRYVHPMRLLTSRLLPIYFHRYEIRKQAREQVVARFTEKGRVAGPVPVTAEAEIDDRGLPPEPPLPSADVPSAPDAGVFDVQDWLRDYRLGGTTTRALERVLARCRDEHIFVLLVAPPVSGPHRSCYTAAIEEPFQAYVRMLTRDYGCRFVDYRTRVPDRCFRDHHHMNAEGGEYFSRLLAREVLIPAWRELKSGDSGALAGEPGVLTPGESSGR